MPEKRVGELLRDIREIDWVYPGTPLRQAVELLGRQQQNQGPGFVLVVRDHQQNREILGTVTLADILTRLEPPSLSDEGDIPIFWQGQFREAARQLLTGEVTQVMVPPEHALNRNSTLMEALHVMNSRDSKILVVMEGEAVVGLISREHLCREIVKATLS